MEVIDEDPSDYELEKALGALREPVEHTGWHRADSCGCDMFLIAGQGPPPCHVHGWRTGWTLVR